MGFGEERQRAEDGGTVYGGECSFYVCQAESIAEIMAYLAPYQQAYSSDTNARIVEYLFVGDV